jgi:hypothetical protein
MQKKHRRPREAAYQQGRAEYDELVLVPTFRDFVVLYIAEGYKRSRNTLSISNSDPAVIAVSAGGSSALPGAGRLRASNITPIRTSRSSALSGRHGWSSIQARSGSP